MEFDRLCITSDIFTDIGVIVLSGYAETSYVHRAHIDLHFVVRNFICSGRLFTFIGEDWILSGEGNEFLLQNIAFYPLRLYHQKKDRGEHWCRDEFETVILNLKRYAKSGSCIVLGTVWNEGRILF